MDDKKGEEKWRIQGETKGREEISKCKTTLINLQYNKKKKMQLIKPRQKQREGEINSSSQQH